MPSKPAKQLASRPTRPSHPLGRGLIHHQVHIEAKLSGFWGVLVLMSQLAVVFIFGLATLTLALWLACGATLVALLRALLCKKTTGTSP
jgi:hypothetical protein